MEVDADATTQWLATPGVASARLMLPRRFSVAPRCADDCPRMCRPRARRKSCAKERPSVAGREPIIKVRGACIGREGQVPTRPALWGAHDASERGPKENMIVASLALLGWPSKTPCDRALEVGTSFMQKPSIATDSVDAGFVGKTCGGTYNPGETLTAVVTDGSASSQFMFELDGGALFTSSQRCGGARVYSINSVGVSTAGASGDISLLMAQASSSAGPVRIGNACTLYPASSIPPPPPPAAPVAIIIPVVVGCLILILAAVFWLRKRRSVSVPSPKTVAASSSSTSSGHGGVELKT